MSKSLKIGKIQEDLLHLAQEKFLESFFRKKDSVMRTRVARIYRSFIYMRVWGNPLVPKWGVPRGSPWTPKKIFFQSKNLGKIDFFSLKWPQLSPQWAKSAQILICDVPKHWATFIFLGKTHLPTLQKTLLPKNGSQVDPKLAFFDHLCNLTRFWLISIRIGMI